MNNSRRRYLISYDIRCPKRLRKAHTLCCKNALRIQYSVFEANVTLPELRKLQEQIRLLIDEGEDDVRIYGLHENTQIITLGPPPVAEGVQWIVSAEQFDNSSRHAQ
jgi:CRISPR-associated endonuclease Cas2